jgi:hypothetical protein
MPDTIGGVWWNLRPVKDRPGCQRNLVPALGALVAPLVHQFIRSFVPASCQFQTDFATEEACQQYLSACRWSVCHDFAKVGGLLRRFGQAGRYRKLGKWFKIKEAQNVGA